MATTNTSDYMMKDTTVTSEQGLIPNLYPWNEVYTAYYSEWSENLQRDMAALDQLNFGWRLDSYFAPIDDSEDRREYRLVAWKDVTSDASLVPRPVE